MNKKILRFCAIVWGISGLVILISVLYPIVSYEATANADYPNLIKPIVQPKNTANAETDVDFTKASNWFPTANDNDFTNDKVGFYTVSIPALNIEDATVAIGGEDLSENLIQYPGTAIPGKSGNSVVFGHSILPIFYNPKDYLAIFSTLPTLKNGNEIIVNYDGISYTYIVEDKFEVLPTDVEILEQNSSDSYLSLVTCTPPGHPGKPKRLIVRAKILPTQADAGNHRANANIN